MKPSLNQGKSNSAPLSVTLQIDLFTNHIVAHRLADIRPTIFAPVIHHSQLSNERCKSRVLTKWSHVGSPKMPYKIISTEAMEAQSHNGHSIGFIDPVKTDITR